MYIIFCHFSTNQCMWSGVSPQLRFLCRRTVGLAISANHLPYR